MVPDVARRRAPARSVPGHRDELLRVTQRGGKRGTRGAVPDADRPWPANGRPRQAGPRSGQLPSAEPSGAAIWAGWTPVNWTTIRADPEAAARPRPPAMPGPAALAEELPVARPDVLSSHD